MQAALDSALFKTRIRLEGARRCFPKDSVIAELECHLYKLTKYKEIL